MRSIKPLDHYMSCDLPRFFWPFTLPPVKLLLLFVMELLFHVFCCFSCSVADGDDLSSFCCSNALKLFKLDVDPLCDPSLVGFDVFSILSIKLFTDSLESWRVIKVTGFVVPFVTFFKTLPLVFCFRRCSISCLTVVRIDCCDSLDDATTETKKEKLNNCSKIPCGNKESDKQECVDEYRQSTRNAINEKNSRHRQHWTLKRLSPAA